MIFKSKIIFHSYLLMGSGMMVGLSNIFMGQTLLIRKTGVQLMLSHLHAKGAGGFG